MNEHERMNETHTYTRTHTYVNTRDCGNCLSITLISGAVISDARRKNDDLSETRSSACLESGQISSRKVTPTTHHVSHYLERGGRLREVQASLHHCGN